MPNNATLKATKRGRLGVSHSLSKEAKAAVILPGLNSSSLISFGKLCDDDCNVLLKKQKMYAVKKNEIVLEGIQFFLINYGIFPFITPTYRRVPLLIHRVMPDSMLSHSRVN